MNTIMDLILPQGRTPSGPAHSVRNNGRLNGACNLAGEGHFQLSTKWRNDDDDHRVCERVIGPKKCLTNQILPVADQFPHVGLRGPSAAAMGSGGPQHGAGLTNCQGTVQGEMTLAFFQAFDGS